MVQQVQAGTVHAHATLSNWYCMKKAMPRDGIRWEKLEILPRVAVSLGLRESPQHIALLAMDKQSFHLSSEVSGHSAGWWEICLVPKSTLALNGRLCAQPQ